MRQQFFITAVWIYIRAERNIGVHWLTRGIVNAPRDSETPWNKFRDEKVERDDDVLAVSDFCRYKRIKPLVAISLRRAPARKEIIKLHFSLVSGSVAPGSIYTFFVTAILNSPAPSSHARACVYCFVCICRPTVCLGAKAKTSSCEMNDAAVYACDWISKWVNKRFPSMPPTEANRGTSRNGYTQRITRARTYLISCSSTIERIFLVSPYERILYVYAFC